MYDIIQVVDSSHRELNVNIAGRTGICSQNLV